MNTDMNPPSSTPPAPVRLPDYKHDNRPQRGLWAPGGYVNKCQTCGAHYVGDKQSLDCADCAYASPPVSATPPAQPAVVPERCKCFTEVENKLKERGLQVSDSCQALGVASLTLTFSIGFPLQRIDHKKLKHGEPKFLAFSHCPFCGKPYPKDE